jgi:hypothetical protein
MAILVHPRIDGVNRLPWLHKPIPPGVPRYHASLHQCINAITRLSGLTRRVQPGVYRIHPLKATLMDAITRPLPCCPQADVYVRPCCIHASMLSSGSLVWFPWEWRSSRGTLWCPRHAPAMSACMHGCDCPPSHRPLAMSECIHHQRPASHGHATGFHCHATP